MKFPDDNSVYCFFLLAKMALLHDLGDNDTAEQREKQSQYLDFLDDEVFD